MYKTLLKITLIISLLLNSADQGLRPRTKSRDALRPVSLLLSGAAQDRGKKSSAGVKNVVLDLSSGDFETVWLEIHEKYKKIWYAEGKPICLTCKPTTAEEAHLAKRFGFINLEAVKIAQIIAKIVWRRKQSLKTTTSIRSSNYFQEVMAHVVKDVQLGDKLYDKLILVTTDNNYTNLFANALVKNDHNLVEKTISQGNAIPLGFEMVMNQTSLGTFANVLELDANEMQHYITYEERMKLEQSATAAKTKEKEGQDNIVAEIKGEISNGKLDEALALIQGELLGNKFKGDKGNLIILLAKKYIEKNDFSKAEELKELLKSFFGSRPRSTAAKGFLEKFKVAKKKKLRAEQEVTQRGIEDNVNNLLKQGKWAEAWDTSGGNEAKNKKYNSLCQRVLEEARKPDNVPEFLPPMEYMELLRLTKSAIAAVEELIKPGKKVEISDQNAVRKSCRELAKYLLLLDDIVFTAINKFAKACSLKALKSTKDNYDIKESNWPATKNDFESRVLANLLSSHAYSAKEDRRRLQTAVSIMLGFFEVIDEFYDLTDRFEAARRTERLLGIRADESVPRAMRAEDDIDDSQEDERRICVRNIMTGMQRSVMLDDFNLGKEVLAESLLGYIIKGIAFPYLNAIGIGPYPSFGLLQTLMYFGAMPMLAPSEVADKLQENLIFRKDVITSASGASAIRIFLKREGYFDCPRSNGIFLVYLYPLDPKDPTKTRSREETLKLMEDWPRLLESLRKSSWEGEDALFVVGAIDYEFTSENGLKNLLKTLFPEANHEELDEKLRRILEIQQKTKEMIEKAEPETEIEEPEPTIDERYHLLVNLGNYFVFASNRKNAHAEITRASRDFVTTLFDPVYDDMLTQGALTLSLSGTPYVRSEIKRILTDTDSYSDRFIELRSHVANAYHLFGSEQSRDLKAPWEIFAGWDPEAPKEEISEEVESRRELWQLTMEVVTHLITYSWPRKRFPDNILFGIDEDGHPLYMDMMMGKHRFRADPGSRFMNARYLRVLEKIGYEPFIEESALSSLVNNALTQESVKVVGPTENSPPSIVITLNERWGILDKKAAEVTYLYNNEIVTDKLVVVLFDENGIVLDEAEYHKYVDKETGTLIKDDEGDSILSKAIIAGQAKVAVPYVLTDVDKFNKVLEALAVKKELIPEKIRAILNQMPKNRKSYSIEQVIAGPYEEARVDNALERIGKHHGNNDLPSAMQVLKNALKEFPDNKLLITKKQELEYLCKRRDLLVETEKVAASRSKSSVETLDNALTAIEDLYKVGAEIYEIEWQEVVKADRKGHRIWRLIKNSAEKAKRRQEHLVKAERILRNDPDQAISFAESARMASWDGNDIQNLIEKAKKRKDEILANRVARTLTKMGTLASDADSISALFDLEKHLDIVINYIDRVKEQSDKSRLEVRVDEIRNQISEKMEVLEKDIAETRNRIDNDLRSIKDKITVVKMREELHVLGSRCRGIEREMNKLTEANNNDLKQLLEEVKGLYGKQKDEIGKAVKSLRKEIRGLLSDAKSLAGISSKDAAETGIRTAFVETEEKIPQIPSSEVQGILLKEFEEVKQYVKERMDEHKADSLSNLLDHKIGKLSDMVTEWLQEIEEGIAGEIESLCISDIEKQYLLAKYEEAIEAYDAKKLAIEQRKKIKEKSAYIEEKLQWLCAASPKTIEKYMEEGAVNFYTEIKEFLESLKTEDPETEAYVAQTLRRLNRITEIKQANLDKFKNGKNGNRKRDKKSQEQRAKIFLDRIDAAKPALDKVKSRLAEQETSKFTETPLDEVELSLAEDANITEQPPETPTLKQIQKILPKTLQWQLGKAVTKEDLEAVAKKAREMIANASGLNFSAPEMQQFVNIRDEASAKARKTAPAGQLIDNAHRLESAIAASA